MAKGQMRSTREKKKPKSDKNKAKNAPAAAPFASMMSAAKSTRGHAGKKSP